jgi:hypothetical protein
MPAGQDASHKDVSHGRARDPESKSHSADQGASRPETSSPSHPPQTTQGTSLRDQTSQEGLSLPRDKILSPSMSRQTLTDQAGSVAPASRFPRRGGVVGSTGVAAVGLQPNQRNEPSPPNLYLLEREPSIGDARSLISPLPGSRRPKLPSSNAGHSSRSRLRLTTDHRFD